MAVDIVTYSNDFLDAVAQQCKSTKLPVLLGIDVGQINCGLWMGTPLSVDECTVSRLGEVRFRFLAWMHLSCKQTPNADQACKAVCAALLPYLDNGPLQFATIVVIEKQYKRNYRALRIAASLHQLFKARKKPVVSRGARFKFISIALLPCPMPAAKADRKRSAVDAVGTVLRRDSKNNVGSALLSQTYCDAMATIWLPFFQAHADKADDICDAALLAWDYFISTNTQLRRIVASRRALQNIVAELRERRQTKRAPREKKKKKKKGTSKKKTTPGSPKTAKKRSPDTDDMDLLQDDADDYQISHSKPLPPPNPLSSLTSDMLRERKRARDDRFVATASAIVLE